MTAELRLTESQKLEVGNIVRKLNRNGGFVIAFHRLVIAGAGYFARWSTFKAIERNRAEYMSEGRMLRTENNGYTITFSNPRS
ncbi:hypothetical protein SAMN05216327_104155 [Dyadobacter sp. SG02]|nr:hypothetical protein SAMN05216327_104155 [Dyadobacter sp. SG02]